VQLEKFLWMLHRAPPVTPITNSFTGIAADESEGKIVVSAAAPPIAIVSRRVSFILISCRSTNNLFFQG
jgi:hypothetical protein